MGRELKWGVDDVSIELVDVVAIRVGRIVVERKVAAQHRVEDDTTAPDVDGAPDVHALTHDQLGRGVARAATTGAHEIVLLLFELVGESKVSDDDVPGFIEEEIFEFEISMDDVFRVQVMDARDELGKEFRGIAFFEITMGKNVIKELSTYGKGDAGTRGFNIRKGAAKI